MEIDLSKLTPQKCEDLLTQTVIPRPIAWVLTKNIQHQNYNLAPFSYFNVICSNPAAIMLSISSKSDKEKKDTAKNLSKLGTLFVIHIASAQESEHLNNSAASFAYGESEVKKLKMSLCSWGFAIPRLEKTPIALACELWKVIKLDENTMQSLLLAKVHNLYAKNEIVSEDKKGILKICAKKTNPLARLGSKEYTKLGEIFSVDRPL